MVAVNKAGEELAVHALVAVGAKDGGVGAGEVVEAISRAMPEMVALVVAGEDRPGRHAASRRHFGLDKE